MNLLASKEASQIHCLWPVVVDICIPWLSLKELKCLSIICAGFFAIIKRYIEGKYPFRIPAKLVLSYFAPQTVRICSHSTEIPSSATNITYIPNSRFVDEPTSAAVCSECNFPTLPPPVTVPPLPSRVTYLKILGNTQPFPVLPPSLTHLTLRDYRNPITALPASLTHLTLVSWINHPLVNLPPSITHLALGARFNHPLDLPEGLLSLSVGNEFDHPIDNLPSTLKSLTVGTGFSQPINRLPPSLTNLSLPSFGSHFTHSLPLLPLSLQHLRLPYQYSFTIDDFPPSLISLNIPTNHPVNKIPSSIQQLTLEDSQKMTIDTNGVKIATWPSKLRELTCFNFSPEGFQNLPATITELHIHCTNDPSPVFPFLPKSISYMMLSLNRVIHDLRMDKLPPITSLMIRGFFDQPLDNLPVTLRHLTVISSFKQSIDHLPPLTSLKISGSFNQCVDYLPPSLLHLSLGNAFNLPIDKLPSSLQTLELGMRFNHPIHSLPPSLASLSLANRHFSHSLDLLPPTLSVIFLKVRDLKDRGISFQSFPSFISIRNY